MNIGDVFKGRARKYNCYQETICSLGRKCIDCMRWRRLSYPYTCNDYEMYGFKGESCLNWTNDKDCYVD